MLQCLDEMTMTMITVNRRRRFSRCPPMAHNMSMSQFSDSSFTFNSLISQLVRCLFTISCIVLLIMKFWNFPYLSFQIISSIIIHIIYHF